MRSKLLSTFYFLGTAIIIFGALQKILHRSSANIILEVGFLFAIVFTSFAIFEIMQSKTIQILEKLMWVLGLLFINTIAGFIYIVIARRKIVKIN